MKGNREIKRIDTPRFAKLSIVTISLYSMATIVGAEKDFADAPLFLQSGVQPNIMFALDDSGSMSWNNVYSNEVKAIFGSLDTQLTDDDIDVTPNWNDRDDVLHTCSGINRMYFDPSKTYTPWEGKDKDGNVYTNIDATNAPFNPYDPDDDTIDLTTNPDSGEIHPAAGYYPWQDLDGDGEWDHWVDLNGNGVFDDWVDLNGNGVFDRGESEYECPVAINDAAYLGDLRNNRRADRDTARAYLQAWFVDYSEMPAIDANLQTNFANWFSYYRKREHVAKRAMSELITNSIARIGMITLNNNNNVGVGVRDVDDLTSPVDLTARANKEDLLDRLFRVDSEDGTPLRRRLEDIGEYYEGSSSPILPADDGGKCQQNFAIMLSDGVRNGGDPSVGNADANTSNPFDGGVYADKNSNQSNTLADVAMYYYKRDLRPGYPDEVPTIKDVDENPAQHMVTYMVAFGLSGTLDPNIPPTDPGFAGWPDPNTDARKIDDVRHAAFNGRGLYLEAQDPEALITSLNDAVIDIQERTGSAASVSVNSGSYSSIFRIYQSRFNSINWDGSVYSYELDANGTPTGTAQLASKIPDHANRVIVSWNDDTQDGVPFKWGELSSAQQTVIGSEDVLNYVRGDQSKEEDKTNGIYRERVVTPGSVGPLGDIVHSSPVLVGEPQYRYPDTLESKSYTDYRADPDGDSTYKTVTLGTEQFVIRRNPMLYVGSNDGMLHAFNVDLDPARSSEFGNEVFAYAPSTVFNRYSNLVRPQFIHTYTVDGTPTTGDAFFGDEWRTILVGGLNSGGQGYYALDVSKPAEFANETTAKDNVLWEFNDTDDSDLGFTFAKPVIAKSNSQGKWVAIFGNGYNNTYSDGVVGTGTAVLYVVDLETGDIIKKIDTGVKDLSTANGLSSPTAVDHDGDYDADYVYAGDLEGNIWKFDISSSDPNQWDVAYGSAGSYKPLFTACSADTCDLTNRQPITTPVKVALNVGAQGGYLVYAATGSYLYDQDLQDTSTQSVYGIWDRNQSLLTSFNRSHLLQQAITLEGAYNVDLEDGSTISREFRQTTDKPMTWHGLTGLPTDLDLDGELDAYLGWYMDLVNTQGGNTDGYGERVIYDIELQRDFVVFSTLIPSTDPCSAGGEGWIMSLKQYNGGQPTVEDPFFDINIDGGTSSEDTVEFVTGGGSEAPSGVKEMATGCVFVTLADGSEVCVTGDPGDPEIKSIPTGGENVLGRWMWQEL